MNIVEALKQALAVGAKWIGREGGPTLLVCLRPEGGGGFLLTQDDVLADDWLVYPASGLDPAAETGPVDEAFVTSLVNAEDGTMLSQRHSFAGWDDKYTTIDKDELIAKLRTAMSETAFRRPLEEFREGASQTVTEPLPECSCQSLLHGHEAGCPLNKG